MISAGIDDVKAQQIQVTIGFTKEIVWSYTTSLNPNLALTSSKVCQEVCLSDICYTCFKKSHTDPKHGFNTLQRTVEPTETDGNICIFCNFKWSALCTFISKYAKSVIGDMPNNFQLKEKDISSCLLKAVFFPIRVKPTRPNVNYAKD